MNIDSTYKILEELGLKIIDYKLFGEFVKKNNNSYDEVIDKIRTIKDMSDKKIDYTEFEKNLVNYLKDIQKIINKDSLFSFSNEEDIDNFKKYFQDIINKYIIISKLKEDKDNCKIKYDEIINLKNEIDNLNKSSVSLTSNDMKTINDLKFDLDVKTIEYRKYLSYIEESTKSITKYSNKSEFIKLLWKISKDISELSNIMNKLSLTNETRKELSVILDDISKYFKNMEYSYIQDINNYIKLCQECGITSNVKSNNIDKPIENKVDNQPDDSLQTTEAVTNPKDNIKSDFESSSVIKSGITDKKFTRKDAFSKALLGLNSKNINYNIKNIINRLCGKPINQEELINLDELSKVYEDKSGKKR